MSGRLAGRVALVTGGGAGIGRSVVGRFVGEGARVGILERATARAEELRAEFGSAVCTVVGDVSHPEDNAKAVRRTIEAFGSLQIFVGNAGIYDRRAPFERFDARELAAAFDELFSVNVKGYLLGVHAALPHLRRAKGVVILTASVSSLAAGFGGVLYVATKHAVAGATRQLSYELAPEIRVNAVAPGYVPTSLEAPELLNTAPSTEVFDPNRVPLGGEFVADDFIEPYVMLASDQGRVFTGSILIADGGLTNTGSGSRRFHRSDGD